MLQVQSEAQIKAARVAPVQTSDASDGLDEMLTISGNMGEEFSGNRGEELQPPSAFAPMCVRGGVEEFSVLRIHGKEPSSLTNRNVADSNGELEILLEYFNPSDREKASAQWLTKWAVEADAEWTTYSKCHYNHLTKKDACTCYQLPCSRKRIGCRALADVNGTWYSFPEDGECASGTTIGTNGCTWKANPVRTISLACLYYDRGVSGMIPWYNTSQFLHAGEALDSALATSDPAQGGCPDSTPAA